ncbi:peptidoglycan D,D-transpeptidase FtsI family protein [Naumannella halotolerans]|uniref:peptidoglycan D,D-transpeptidase FtsI family protein n=1 Tax=Naumannella halotolerans TaxID=993414 RepID=UPI00370D3ACA
MNRPIRRISVVAMVMFALLLGNVTYSALVRYNTWNADPANNRVRDAQFGQDRGPILAAGQVPLAETEPSDGRFDYQRVYPTNPELYAPITGYYSYSYGRSALENSYNAELSGTDDSQFLSRVIDSVTGETPTGATVETTIVPAAQQAAWDGLAGRKGAVVAMNPQTGAILAMVTTPSYDPNELGTHDNDDASEAWTSLNDDADRPMANRAAREIYPPGSTFKLVTAAAALESGMSPDDEIDSPEQYTLPQTNTQLGNETNCGGDRVSLDQALQVSCNTAFAGLGVDLGAEALQAQADKFGFGTRPLPDLAAVASQFPDDPNGAQTALAAIGQGDVAASPLQMTMVTSGIANGGVVMDPYVVDTVRADDLSVLRQTQPRERSTAMSSENADALAEMMVHVVESGTGVNGQMSGVTVGGKTGTAQTTEERPPYAWFTAFGGEEGNPSVAVTVFIEEADIERSDIAGGRLAAPIARDVMEAVL